jgi:hypothetical protein
MEKLLPKKGDQKNAIQTPIHTKNAVYAVKNVE